MQVLQSDCAQVQRVVQEAVRQLSAPASASSAATPLDNCQLMEAMNDSHNAQLLPRLRLLDQQVAAFCQRCMDSKVGAQCCTHALLLSLMKDMRTVAACSSVADCVNC